MRNSFPYGKCIYSFIVSVFLQGRAISAEAADACGEKLHPLSYYDDISLYAIIAASVFIIAGIVMDKTISKTLLLGAAVLPLGLWVYIHYFINFDEIKRINFTYNAAAESALANIAEAQDRYKSEQDAFLTDLDKLYSHTAGSHGIDTCVKIIKIEAGYNHWYAEAKHVSSADKVIWDSKKGSSLIKG